MKHKNTSRCSLCREVTCGGWLDQSTRGSFCRDSFSEKKLWDSCTWHFNYQASHRVLELFHLSKHEWLEKNNHDQWQLVVVIQILFLTNCCCTMHTPLLTKYLVVHNKLSSLFHTQLSIYRLHRLCMIRGRLH